MTTITCIIRDNHDGYHDPLIYTVDVDNPQDQKAVHAACVKERAADLGFDDGDELDIDVLFAFAGNVIPIADWRE